MPSILFSFSIIRFHDTTRTQLENNLLTGPIPAGVVLMTQTQLTSWSLKGNPKLSLPNDIGAVTVLTTLNLPNQNLTGRVPAGIMYLKCLKSIDLRWAGFCFFSLSFPPPPSPHFFFLELMIFNKYNNIWSPTDIASTAKIGSQARFLTSLSS
jgi:hypothetical protein